MFPSKASDDGHVSREGREGSVALAPPGPAEGEHCVEVLAHGYPGHSEQTHLEAVCWG